MNKFINWCKEDLPYLHLEFARGVKNLIRWFPIIWKDRDWDDYFIFKILKFKIENQAKYIGTRDFHTRAKRDAEVMMLCARLIDKVQTEFYSSEYYDYHEVSLDFTDIEDDPNHYGLQINRISENYDEYLSKYKKAARIVKNNPKYQIFKLTEFDLESKERLVMNVAYYNHYRAKRLLFELLSRNIEKWWD